MIRNRKIVAEIKTMAIPAISFDWEKQRKLESYLSGVDNFEQIYSQLDENNVSTAAEIIRELLPSKNITTDAKRFKAVELNRLIELSEEKSPISRIMTYSLDRLLPGIIGAVLVLVAQLLKR